MDLIETREQARQYLKNHELSRDELAKRMDVPYWWVQKFANGDITNPSIDRLQKVMDFMLTYGQRPAA
jgi:transcriptional regulator with XRE-family HTH domain